MTKRYFKNPLPNGFIAWASNSDNCGQGPPKQNGGKNGWYIPFSQDEWILARMKYF
jgi:hypothetical protein